MKIVNAVPPTVHSFILIATAFSFPFGKNITSICLITFASIFVIQWSLRLKEGRFPPALSKECIVLYCLPGIYYLWTVVGMLYTENFQQGVSELTKKLSFVILPFAFAVSANYFSQRTINTVLSAFLYATLISAFASLSLGFYNSFEVTDSGLTFRTAINDVSFRRGDSFLEQQTQGGNYFFGTHISPFLNNIIYYAIYLSYSLLIWFLIPPIRKRLLLLSFGTLLFVILFFCDSRGPLLSFLLTLVMASFLLIARRTYPVLILPALIAAVIFTVFLSPRISLLIKDFDSIRASLNYHSEESTSLRLIVWEASTKIIKENWILGVGTGDADDAILEITEATNRLAFEKQLNSHNQYLQTFISSGIVGFLFLLILLVYPLLRAIRNDNYALAFLIMIISFNMLFESIFQVFHGIQFFIFFYCLLVMKLNFRS